MISRVKPNLTNPGTVNCAGMLSPAVAIQAAQVIKDNQDVSYSPQAYRNIIAGLMSAIDSSPTFRKAVERDQEVFVLVQQDIAAPRAIEAWAWKASNCGGAMRKVGRALIIAQRWKLFPIRKAPD